MMTLSVLLFAQLRQACGSDQIKVELSSSATYGELRDQLAEQFTAWRELIAASRVAAGGEFVDLADSIDPTVEIALIPPVSGG